MKGEEGRSQVSPKDAAVNNNISESHFTAAETERGRSMGQHEGCACKGRIVIHEIVVVSADVALFSSRRTEGIHYV